MMIEVSVPARGFWYSRPEPFPAQQPLIIPGEAYDDNRGFWDSRVEAPCIITYFRTAYHAFAFPLESTHEDVVALTKLHDRKWLSVIDCHDADVTDTSLSLLIESFPHVEGLSVGYSSITDADLQRIASLRNIRSLSLSGCHRISDAGVAVLGDLTKLQTLRVGECDELQGECFTQQGKFCALEYLRCSWTGVNERTVRTICQLERLREIELIECPELTSEDIDRLRCDFPHLHIVAS